MYGLGAVKTLGVRIGKDLTEHLTQTAKRLNSGRTLGYGRWDMSKVARRVLEDFFSGKNDFRKLYENAGKPGKRRKK